ncbi:MAG: DEAD/DEAH box helicase [Bacteroidales bacterium]|nr:DEAD/DEAH box helicase [Bacteroidales bacterium]
MREIRFALGYTPHRLWGNILQARFLEKEHGKEFFIPREYIQNDESTQAYNRLTPMQQEVVRIIDAYSDRNLFRAFSKKKTVKEFQDSVDKETINNHIRPYIERHLYTALEIARDNRISIFVKDKGDGNVFPEDFLRVEKYPADPVFSFKYGEVLSYSLSLIHGKNKLILHDGFVEIVSNSPTSIILEKSLYFINEIDGKKLKPFLDKEQVLIPRKFEKEYFSTFVRNTLRDFNTITEGFNVNELRPATQAELVLEEGMNNLPVWILTFYYNNKMIYPDSRLKRFVNYTGDGKSHGFERFHRDKSWEESIVTVLNELGLRSRDQKIFRLNQRFNKENENDLFAAINFLNESGPILADSEIRVRHRLQNNYYLGKIDLELESREQEDWFDVYAVVRFGDHKVPFLFLRKHILRGTREYALPGGEIAILPEEWFARYRSIFEFGRAEGDRIMIHKQHFSMVEGTMREFHAETLARLERLNEVELLPSQDLPEGLNADLRTYQKEGYEWLCFLQQNGFGGCLADDMGLGKTLQAIAVLLRSKEEGPVIEEGPASEVKPVADGQLSMFGGKGGKHTSLIVLPASLLHNWLSECMRFAPGLEVYSYVGNQRNRELTNFSCYDIVLSTYHTVRQDIEQLSTFQFHYIILDESQMIKNPSSKLYQSMIELRSEYKIVLTGTPIENSLTDLWSQINFVNPGLLGTLNFFKRSFVHPIEKKKDEQREEKLRELINPFILRRTKQEVAQELPPVYEQVRYCNMTEAQRRLYDEEKSLARNSILENMDEVGLDKCAFMVLQALTRLRQIANHPAMLEDINNIDSGKFAEVYRDIESVLSEGHKVLIFSSFVKHLNLFRTRLDEDGINYAYLTGSQNLPQREKAVKDFQKNKNCQLFLISLKAGGVGLNLTSADYVFILDPWWNPAAELQALSRAHRIGQEKNVFVYRFISNDTIEEKIQRLQARKRELAEAFVTSNNPLKSLSQKELLELFS